MKSLFFAATPSWFSGAARLVDFGGQFDSYNSSPSEAEADLRAIEADWRVVGQDIRSAEDTFSKEQNLR